MTDIKRETEVVQSSELSAGLDADSSKKLLVDMLLDHANLYSCETGELLRAAAFRLAAIEYAAKKVVKGTETKNLKMLERGVNGLKILVN